MMAIRELENSGMVLRILMTALAAASNSVNDGMLDIVGGASLKQ